MDLLDEFLQTLKTHAAKQAGYIFVSSVAAKFVAFLSMVVLVRSLSVEQYGMISTAISIAALFSGLLFAGLNTTMTRFGALFLKKKDVKASLLFSTTFWIEMLIAVILLILGWASSPYIAQYAFRKAFLAPFIRGGFFIGLGMVLANYAFSFFQTHERFKGYSLLTFSYSFLTFAAVYVLAKLGMLTPNFALVAYVYAPFVVFIAASNLILKQGLAPKIDMKLFKELWAFGRWVILGSVFVIIYSQLPIFFLARYRSIEDVGVFSFANNIYMAVMLLPTAINTVVLPRITKLITKEEMRDMTNRLLKITPFVAFALIPIFLFSEQIIALISATKYIDAVLPLKILIIGVVVSLIAGPISYFLLPMNRPDIPAKVNLVGIFLNIIGGLTIIREYGLLGAAIVSTLSFSIVTIIQASYALINIRKD